MTLNVQGKNWLAQYAGNADKCFTNSGINYTDPDGIGRTGGTGDVANAFYVAHLVGLDNAVIIASTNYNQLKSKNCGSDINLADVGWIYNNDGYPTGESRYCDTGIYDCGGVKEGIGGFGIVLGLAAFVAIAYLATSKK